MPKLVKPLSELQVKNARPGESTYTLFDGRGLFLEVTPQGSKLWRLKYTRPSGGVNRLSLGRYPDVSLAMARERRDQAKRLLAKGIDPSEQRKDEKAARDEVTRRTFELVAREWHAIQHPKWTQRTSDNIMLQLERDIFPEIGALPIQRITTADVLRAIRKIETRGVHETAHRVTANVNRIFIFALHSGLVDRNPADHLVKVLKPTDEEHFAAIGPDQLPDFLRALASNEARMGPVVRIAMRLMMLVFVRTSELIETHWDEIDLEQGRWVIPWRRMKMGRRRVKPIKIDHDTCLPRQAVDLLRELHTYTGGGKMLFPNQRDPNKPISNNTLLAALKRMGYQGVMTGHGFRALAMTTLKERLGYRHEVVDRQLAHVPKDKLESAYDRGAYFDERRRMMQDWADFLDREEAQALTRKDLRRKNGEIE
ncbi:MAG: tyrosine-type recombinase/integrase [Telluria sp.]